MADLKEIRKQRAERTGLYPGLGVRKNVLSIIDDYVNAKGLTSSRVTGEEVARRTYGDKFEEMLEKAKQHYIEYGDKIPAELHQDIPSYNINTWRIPIETYMTGDQDLQYGSHIVRGVTGKADNNLPKIITTDDAIGHEVTHGMQFLSDNDKHELTTDEYVMYPGSDYPDPKKIFKPFDNTGTEYSYSNLDLYKTGYKAAFNPAETVAYVTDVNRMFYKKHNRKIESQQDLEQGLKLLEESGSDRYIQKGKADALREKAHTLDLSKMLIQRGENKAKGKT